MSDGLDRLGHPPRAVPLRLALALRFGGVNGLIGWIFFAFSMVFITVFVAVGDFGRMLDLSLATLESTPGVATGWSETNTQVNDGAVLRNFAAFEVKGHTYECHGYAIEEGLAEGTAVVVEYDPEAPTRCRIQGMAVSSVPWWVLLIISPFSLIGLGFAGWRWRTGARLVRVLRRGKLAWGKRISKSSTGVQINDEMQFKYVFRFEDERGRAHEVVARTVDTYALEDEPREAILYDPARPSVAMVADTEADVLRVDERGRWAAPPASRVVPLLIAPTIAAALGAVTIWLF